MLSHLSGFGSYIEPDIGLLHGCRLAIIDWSVMCLFPLERFYCGMRLAHYCIWNNVIDAAS